MSTYQSVQSAGVDNSNILVITKPVSLAVGDLLLAGIWADRDGGSSVTLATPAGWTEENYILVTSNSALGIYTKVADSADVAASNFTFTGGGSTSQMHMIGHLMRITNYGNSAGDTADVGTGAISSFTLPSITPSPAIASALYVVFAGRSFAGTPSTFVSVAMATSNPSWTKQAESTVNGSTTFSRFAAYTATRPETTATGLFTVTFNNTDNLRSAGGAIALNPRIDGSISSPEIRGIGYAFTPIQSVELEAEATSPTTNTTTPTQWTNPDKGTTTWTNPNK